MLTLLCVVGIELFQMLQSRSRIESLGTGEWAKANLIALSQLHITTKHLKSLLCELVTRIDDPTVCLQKDWWTKVVLWNAQVRGAYGLGACYKKRIRKGHLKAFAHLLTASTPCWGFFWSLLCRNGWICYFGRWNVTLTFQPRNLPHPNLKDKCIASPFCMKWAWGGRWHFFRCCLWAHHRERPTYAEHQFHRARSTNSFATRM